MVNQIGIKDKNAYLYTSNTNYAIYTQAENIFWNSNMSKTFYQCKDLNIKINKFNEYPFYSNNIENMYQTFYGCQNITGTPFCGVNTTDLTQAYAFCNNIDKFTLFDTGHNPYCTYYGCNGNAFTSENINKVYNSIPSTRTSLYGVFSGIQSEFELWQNNFSNNIKNMAECYANCINLTGTPTWGPNTTNLYRTFYRCPNISGVIYLNKDINYDKYFSSSTFNMTECFYGHTSDYGISIYVNENGNYDKWLWNEGYQPPLFSASDTNIKWSVMSYGYYNNSTGIFIYNKELPPADGIYLKKGSFNNYLQTIMLNIGGNIYHG